LFFMVVIGITGGVGTGKSTVARMFQRLGAARLDADAVAHELIAPGRRAWREIAGVFGAEVLGRGGRMDRARLARIVFANRAKRRRLERIIHPRVLRALRRQLSMLRRRGRAAAVVEIPLLFEAGARRLVDAVVVVAAPAGAQRARLRAAGWSLREIDARRRAQWRLSAKAALADYVIDNGNGVEATRTQVKRIWSRLGLARRPK
jgi:dephospho-CoA kinase